MQLKHKNSLLLLISIPIIILLLILTTNKQDFQILKEDSTQKLMSQDLGISYFRNLIDTGENNTLTLNAKIISLIRSIPKIIEYKLYGDKFDRIDISIDYSDYLILMKNREQGIKDNILINPSKVNAILEHKGKKYKAKLRLKGDLSGHWTSKYRFSVRVQIKNDKHILGFSSFSIQKPRERQHPYDYTFQSMARETGNIASTHKFAHIFLNGDDWGIMDIEEHISKEFLEKQNRKNSIVIRFANDDKWKYTRTSKKPFDAYRLSSSLLFLHLYNDKEYLKDIQNRKAFSYLSSNRATNNKSIYDINSFSKALILSLVWNNMHALNDTNSRYYFNPYTLKLEPISQDQGYWKKIQDDVPLLNTQYLSYLSNQNFLVNLPMNLKKVGESVSNINNHLSYPQLLFPVDKKKNTKIIDDNMKKILNNYERFITSQIISYSAEELSKDKAASPEVPILPTKTQASEFTKHLHIKHYMNGNLELYNLLPDNVVVRDISFNGKSFTNEEIIIPSYFSRAKPTIIKTQFKGIQDNMFIVKTNYQGFDRTVKNNFTLISDGIKNPLLANTAHEFNFITKLDNKTYKIEQGNWTVKKPIIVEGDLVISPGVNLQFSKDSYLIVKGSLTAVGKKENPITLKSLLNSWKGIYVLNSFNKSLLKNVNISNISALEDELLKLSGGITFYKSDVDFENVRINDVKAEDAINIIESSFSLNSVVINNTISDGLDSDFSNGSVMYSKFTNIGGDALDFSGSYASINQTKVTNVKDKAISAGENSTLNIENSNFENIGVGVASKDASSVTMSNSIISNYKLYAAMSYVKKDYYGKPDISINNCIITDGNKFIRQKGTSMIVNNVDIPESEISIKKLYKTNVMSK